MSELKERQEILDLLARGKINVDEAVAMLNQTNDIERNYTEDPVFKADMMGDLDPITNNETLKSAAKFEDEIILEENRTEGSANQKIVKTPRWLRINVSNLENGKSKVSVNVPIALVKFGLGMARVLVRETEQKKLDEIGTLFSNSEQGLLVDVEDTDSNEHVQIYLD